MSLNCIYHKTQPMRVVEDEIAERLIASGEWFSHPNCTQEEIQDEKPIRQRTRKGREHGEDTSEPISV